MKKNTPTIQKRKRVELIDLEQALRGRKKAVVVVKKTVTIKKKVTPKTKTTTKVTSKTTKKVKPKFVENVIQGLDGDFMFNGSAKKIINSENRNSFILTPALRGMVGSVFTKEMMDIESGFKCSFKFQMLGNGADGLAFVIQNSINNAITHGGGDLGYHGMHGGLIAVEFDVYQNQEFKDPFNHHVSIQTRDDNKLLSAHHNKSIGSHLFNHNINDGRIVPVEIIYDNTDSTIKVFLSQNGSLEKNLIINSTIPYKLPSSAFIGFTGSTGYDFQQNIVYDFTFETLNNNSNLEQVAPKSTAVENENQGLDGDFMFNGSAKKIINSENRNSFTLTPAEQGVVGSVFTKEMMDIESGFKCSFKFQMLGNGADGLAFVIQNSTNKAIAHGGGNLGYHGMHGGLIAVEFDVFRNEEFNDPYNHHVSIQTRDDNKLLSAHHNKSIGSYSFNHNINDGRIVPVEITYDSVNSMIRVFLSQNGSLGKSLTLASAIPYKLPSYAFVGFTGSTGYDFQHNIVHDFTFETLKK